ncbi:hypothetical protein SUGI_0126140 [Cryptomeria japonica]|uniref:WUSCHEL-related homeobox 4-like n=1 Tax=Cryptomeria japonica TaxID=3369 RepID=UPI00240899E2|nr:WUSCHEL-related homeobox 4-like [Cryptomeria japonica]GLJ10321.1 hypothetical protein SUGI_0126140 [Cryptomeria japonica]
MDRGSAADSRLTRSTSVIESTSMMSVSSRWRPTACQKRILESFFANGTRKPSVEQVNRITAELQLHGPVEGKNVFFWFQNAAARDKRKRERPETSSPKWPAVLKPRNWTSLFRSKKSSDKKSYVQMEEEEEEEEEEVDSGPRRNSSVDPSDIRTLELFPLHPDL